MPLNKEALPLEPTPASVTAARRWVSTVCQELGRDDLVDCAELGVSELVTNAILHGAAPIFVRVRGTREHPRIEVYDGSRRPPVLPEDPFGASLELEVDDVEAFLTTSGRGLAMVAMASTAWGASIEDSGKVVWFEPASEVRDDHPDGVIEGLDDLDAAWVPPADSVEIQLLHVDTALFMSTLAQYRNLRRELRLLAVSHVHDYPLAAELSSVFTAFERQLPPSTLAHAEARLRESGAVADLTFTAAARSSQVFGTMLEVMDLADSFCRSQRLLSMARTPEQVAMQTWMLEQFMAQSEGAAPVPWTGVAAGAMDSATAS